MSVAKMWFGKVLNTRLIGCKEGRVMEDKVLGKEKLYRPSLYSEASNGESN